MTFTSEERREIAENLRHLTIGHSIQYKEQFFDELAEVVVGFEDYHDFDVVLDKLADLIDRKGETMINDKERKRAVAELREASTGAYRHVDSLDVIANSIGVEVDGKFIHEVENETYAALADLIDRPTCHNVADYTKESFKCSECGCRVLVPGDRPDGVLVVTSEAFQVDWYSCPVCGAVVFDG